MIKSKFLAAVSATVMAFSGSIMAQKMVDVPKTDSAYPAISKTVKQGYLSTFADDSFQGHQAVTRRELAIVIDKLLTETDAQQSGLSKTDIQEIKQLMKTFKQYVSDYETTVKVTTVKTASIEDEQKAINYDMSQVQDSYKKEIAALKKQQQEQSTWFWVGIISAGLFGWVMK